MGQFTAEINRLKNQLGIAESKKKDFEVIIAKLKEAIEHFEEIERLGIYFESVENFIDTKTSSQANILGCKAASSIEFTTKSVAEATKTLLTRSGKPLSTQEIYEGLIQGGKILQAKEPKRSLYNSLFQNSTFTFKDGKWSIKGEAED